MTLIGKTASWNHENSFREQTSFLARLKRRSADGKVEVVALRAVSTHQLDEESFMVQDWRRDGAPRCWSNGRTGRLNSRRDRLDPLGSWQERLSNPYLVLSWSSILGSWPEERMGGAFIIPPNTERLPPTPYLCSIQVNSRNSNLADSV